MTAVVATGFVLFAGVGALARMMVSRTLNELGRLLWGTLLVNMTGSFLLGFISNVSPDWLTVAGTGGLGAFTTFSTFALELELLTREDRLATAVWYALVTIAGCIAAAWAGLALAPG